MKIQGKKERTLKIFALLTVFSMLAGLLAIFPAMAGGTGDSSGVLLLSEDAQTGSAPSSLLLPSEPDYVIWDDSDMIKGLNSDMISSVRNDAAVEHLDESGVVRLKNTKEDAIDPFVGLDLTVNGASFSADEYKYITFVVKTDKVRSATGFELFFATDHSRNYWWDKDADDKNPSRAAVLYQPLAGWQVITMDFSQDSRWYGDLVAFRLDFFAGENFSVGDYVDIAAIAFCEDSNAVYDAAHEVLKSIYAPRQTVKDFKSNEVAYLSDHSSGSNVVSVFGGSAIYKAVYNETIHPTTKEPFGYSDPYSNFKYRAMMIERGLENEILTTEDFSYTVLKYRTSGIAANAIELFMHTTDAAASNQNFASRPVEEIGSPESADNQYNWLCTAVPMKGKNDANADKWLNAETNYEFHGFRVDWCTLGAENAFMEIDEFMFFDNEEDAVAYSLAANTITLPTTLASSSPDMPSTTYSVGFAEDIYKMYSNGGDSKNATAALTALDRVNALALGSDGDKKYPYIILDLKDGVGGFDSQAFYSGVSFAIKRKGIAASDSASFALYYQTENMTGFDTEHALSAKYASIDGWQIISFDFQEMPDWDENKLKSLKLEFLSEAGRYEVGAGCYISAMALWYSRDEVQHFAGNILKNIYAPEQSLGSFAAENIGAFDSLEESNTNVDITVDGILKYSPSDNTFGADPIIDYAEYMSELPYANKINASAAKYTVIKYRAVGISEENRFFTLSMLDENKNPVSSLSAGVEYEPSSMWKSMVFGITGGEEALYGFSADWCGEMEEGATFDIEDILLYGDAEDANNYSSALNALRFTDKNNGAVMTEPNYGDESDKEDETLPPIEDETFPEIETESEGESEDTETESDTTSESESCDETESGSESKTESEVESESESETESGAESESESESESETGDDSDEAPNLPNGFIPPADGDSLTGQEQEPKKSEAPFVVACVALSGLSVASVASVIVIRIRVKTII